MLNPLDINPKYPLPPSVKIVCFSDTHNRYSEGVLDQVYEGDILIHSGDATFEGKPQELEEFNEWLSKQNFRHKIFVPGNHDVSFEKDFDAACKLLPAADHILNQTSVNISGLNIYGEPRQPWFYDWAFNVHREEMKNVWAKVPKDTDILVTHGPPWGAGDINSVGQHCGCLYQRIWVENVQPRMVVAGHIHPGYGIHQVGKTMVVNASNCNAKYNAVNPPISLELSI